ncbi:hypothetical protein XENOCAPTIV_018151, partial [Xenoophorus captivus]
KRANSSGQEEEAWAAAAAGIDRGTVNTTTGERAAVEPLQDIGYRLSVDQRLSRGDHRRVNEVNAALLHLEGRTHGRGGR